MDLQAIARKKIDQIIDSVAGMKILLLDEFTNGVVGMVLSQTDAIQRDILLIDTIDSPFSTRKQTKLARAVIFIRPTTSNFEILARELQNPMAVDYSLFFTNVVKDSHLEMLARADEFESVVQVQEVFLDFVPLRNDLFSLDVPSVADLEPPLWNQASFDRIVDGICASLLSLRKKPVIRCQKNSKIAGKIAAEISQRIGGGGDLFDFRRPGQDPLLLIVDRRDDALTPLLTPWTYEAMVFEHLSMTRGRVDLTQHEDVPAEFKQIVLDPVHDEFFREAREMSFGELGDKLRTEMEVHQTQRQNKEKMSTLEDMHRYLKAFPEMRRKCAVLTKHVELVSEMSRIIERAKMMDVSEAEQTIASDGDRSSSFKLIFDLIENPKVKNIDRLRLFLIFALKFEQEDNRELKQLIMALKEKHVDVSDISLHATLKRYGGVAVRSQDLFASGFVSAAAKKIQRSIVGVDNVYTQHRPLILDTVKQVLAGRLKETLFPYVLGQASREKYNEIIIFFVGGITFEEVHSLAEFSKSVEFRRQNPETKIILGGTCVHNTQSFLAEMYTLQTRELEGGGAGGGGGGGDKSDRSGGAAGGGGGQKPTGKRL